MPQTSDHLVSSAIAGAVEQQIHDFPLSRLANLLLPYGPYAIKFVQSKWASHYSRPSPLKVSETPALTWGTATYVTPLAFPLSSALYGRVGLVTDFHPTNWRVFDATSPAARMAYVTWARAQPSYPELLLTVHSTLANHLLRNQFRERFQIDCVLFSPDQEAEAHTDATRHIWMAVTDWTPSRTIETRMSARLANARFTVLIDEDFVLQDQGLPVRVSPRQIEIVTEAMHSRTPNSPIQVSVARVNPATGTLIARAYRNGGYLHVFIEP